MVKLKKEDIKIETKEYAYWSKVKEETEAQITMLEGRLKFEKFVLENVLVNLKKEKS